MGNFENLLGGGTEIKNHGLKTSGRLNEVNEVNEVNFNLKCTDNVKIAYWSISKLNRTKSKIAYFIFLDRINLLGRLSCKPMNKRFGL